MLTKLISTMVVILLLMLGWVLVQRLARLFARRHPEFGAYREGGSCGSGHCSCGNADSCERGNER